jgi:hypothetical protein
LRWTRRTTIEEDREPTEMSPQTRIIGLILLRLISSS